MVKVERVNIAVTYLCIYNFTFVAIEAEAFSLDAAKVP
jgi:hypothetical protein